MPIYRRGETWWLDFTGPDGCRLRKSAGTTDRRQAQELHDRLKAEVWRQARLGEKPRHTWASWHVQAGTPLHVLQELGGWASLAMVQRYAHLSSDHLAEAAARIAGPLAVQARHKSDTAK